MKIKTALITTCCLSFLLLCTKEIRAQTYFEGTGGGVNVSAVISQDLYSQLDITPNTVEVFQPATLKIQLLNPDGNPKPNRTVVAYVNGSGANVNITQPAISNYNGETSASVYASIPGTYELCAKDVTDGFDIYILDCETIYVVPVASPILLSEPPYTKGLSNTLTWQTSGSGNYTYNIQVSTVSSFSVIAQQSGWIDVNSYEFQNLKDGQIYFYRMKARNAFNAESEWSNVVYSVQDNTSPTLSLLSISGLNDNTTQKWDAEDVVIIKLRAKDNVGIESRRFGCVLVDGSSIDCKESESISGNIWTIRIKLGDLEHDANYYLYTKYSFCAEVVDVVGNVNRVCDIVLNVPVVQTNPPKPINQIVERIKDTVNEVLDNSRKIAQNTVGGVNQIFLQQISITAALGNLLVGISIIVGGIGTIPYVLLQIFLALSSLLGFRKKGNSAGYVYDSVTKEPISQCIVRIFNENSELVWTDVTDKNGYFKACELPLGDYTIRVTNRDYLFPSKVIFGKKDFPLENVYHGQEFYISKGQIPNFSIPMDKKDMGNIKTTLWRFTFISKLLWKALHLILFLGGLLFSFCALSIDRSWYNYLILFLYVPSIVFLILSIFARRDKYGIVRSTSGKKLVGIVLGLKEKEFGKLVSKRVTDTNGRFRFLANEGVYDLVILSTEWNVVNTRDLENIKFKKAGILTKNIVLRKTVKEKKVVEKKAEEVLEPLGEL